MWEWVCLHPAPRGERGTYRGSGGRPEGGGRQRILAGRFCIFHGFFGTSFHDQFPHLRFLEDVEGAPCVKVARARLVRISSRHKEMETGEERTLYVSSGPPRASLVKPSFRDFSFPISKTSRIDMISTASVNMDAEISRTI
jgi:hypothetical protein